jgi:putative protease
MAKRKKAKKKASAKRKKSTVTKSTARKKTRTAKKPAKKTPARRTSPKKAKSSTRPSTKPVRKPARAKPSPPRAAAPTPKPPAQAAPREERVGVVTHYYNHLSVAIIRIESGTLHVGDEIHIHGHTTDFTQKVESLEVDHAPATEVGPNDDFGLKVVEHAREHDVVYKVRP